MHIEQQIAALVKEVENLNDEISKIKARDQESFVTLDKLAEIMQCSTQTVRNKIKSGDIYATRKLGDPKIPMSQFYKSDPVDIIKRKPAKMRKVSGGESMEQLVFGKD